MEGKRWLWLTMVVVVAIFALAGIQSWGYLGGTSQEIHGAGQGASASGKIPISIASSNTKEDWLREAVRAFNAASAVDKTLQVNGRPVFVEVLKEIIDGKPVDYRSGTMVRDTVQQKIKPTILSPGAPSWLSKFKKDWEIAHNSVVLRGEAPVLVRTPLVVAMWQSRAKALGCWPTVESPCTWERLHTLAASTQGWQKFGYPEWGTFKFGYGYFGQSNSGTLGIIAMCMAGVNKTQSLTLADVTVDNGCGALIAGVERAKVHSGKSDIWLLNRMVKGGPDYLDAVITYESNVIRMNRKYARDLREPLVAVYPQDGTMIVGHPFGILDGAPWVTTQHVEAAKRFRTFLLAQVQQEAVFASGTSPG